MEKKLGVGSLSLLLVLLALLWSANLPSGFCLGDSILKLFGFPAWSTGSLRLHYTVFYSLPLLIPAFFLGWKYDHHRFARSGKWLSGGLSGCLLAMGSAILLWG